MTAPALRRQLGLSAVVAIVVGDMLGSGIFFTPGELAAVAQTPAQVYFFWALCGVITLCGALTLAELTTLLPHPGATYHIIREGYGPFWGFLKVWMEMWVSGPGSVAGVAIVFGEFLVQLLGGGGPSAAVWGIAAIGAFTLINLRGVAWGGRTQVALTAAKILGLLCLVGGALFLADAAPAATADGAGSGDWLGMFRLVGLGVAAVLFTYDGWLDVTHVAGEVDAPRRTLPLGLVLGVGGITLLYLVVNYAFLRVLPLDAMRAAPTTIGASVATLSFGDTGGRLVTALMTVSIFGALGGLVMTLPRIIYTVAAHYESSARRTPLAPFFRGLATVSPVTAVPSGAILFIAIFSSIALLFFGSFDRLVTFLLVPLQLANILLVSAIFPLRRRRHREAADSYRTPGFPVVPLLFIGVMAVFLASAIVYNPLDTLIGLLLTATGIPVYLWLTGSGGPASE
jgi:APA family basic amino acid/polyamine antiporter